MDVGDKGATGLVGRLVPAYCSTAHSHVERDNLPPVREPHGEIDPVELDQVDMRSYVGGAIKSFEQKAA